MPDRTFGPIRENARNGRFDREKNRRHLLFSASEWHGTWPTGVISSMKWLLLCGFTLAIFAAGCSDGDAPSTPGFAGTNAAPTYTATAAPTVIPATGEPVRKTYARGETVDIEQGVLYLDPATGGGEAWAAVRPSPSGRFIAWNGGDGKQPPVLYETASHRRIELDTDGAYGTVFDYSPDDSEASVFIGDELRIVSTADGSVRVALPIPAEATFVRAFWGPGGAVAVTAADGRTQASLGVVLWWHETIIQYRDLPGANWLAWSPDGSRFVTSSIGEEGWTAIVDTGTGEVTRIDQALYNPRWSESGEYWDGQLLSGEVLIFRADGTPQMRMNGVCALLGSPWIGDEIATWSFGEGVAVAMDGAVRPFARVPLDGPVSGWVTGGVALWDRPNGAVIAELKLPDSVSSSWFSSSQGVRNITTDGRGMIALGVGGKGFCENVGAFKVELAPFD